MQQKNIPCQLREKPKDFKTCLTSEKALEVTPAEVFTVTTPQQNLNGEPASSSIPPAPHTAQIQLLGAEKHLPSAPLTGQKLLQGCAVAFAQAGRICRVGFVNRTKNVVFAMSLKFGWCCQERRTISLLSCIPTSSYPLK